MRRQSFADSVRNALAGVVDGFRRGRNFRIQVVVFIVMCALGVLRDFSVERWAIVFLVSGVVLALELMNTALETLADQMHPEHHRLIGMAKDMAAGAVLVVSAAAVCIGFLFLIR